MVGLIKSARRVYWRLWPALPKVNPISKVRPARLGPGRLAFRPSGDPIRPWTFPSLLDNPTVPWLAALKDHYATSAAFPGSMSPECGMLLHALVRNMRPKVVVEVGTFLGSSTVWMAAAMREAAAGDPFKAGVIHCFDYFGAPSAARPERADVPPNRLDHVKSLLDRAGLLDMVRFHRGDSRDGLLTARQNLIASGGVHLALVDGDHSIPGVWQDLWAVEPAVVTGGYVIFHDTYPDECSHEGPRHVLDNLEKMAAGVYERCELYTSPLNYGMAVLRRIR
jgi:predicted O-methyltransferase YrrM